MERKLRARARGDGVSIRWMLKALEAKVGNSGRKLVLIKLCDNANDDGICWPSYPYIAEHCEISERSAKAHVKDLVAKGFITSTTRKGIKGNSTNLYKMIFDKGAESAPLDNAGDLRGENSAPLPSAKSAPLDNPMPLRGADISPPSANSALPRGAESAPGISHSFEPVIKEESALPELPPSNLFAINTSIVNKFSMTEDWQPTEKFTGQCKFRGVNLNTFSPDDQEDLINEFRSYWMTQSTQLNQAGWEHKLLSSIKRSSSRKATGGTQAQSARSVITAAIMDIEDTSW